MTTQEKAKAYDEALERAKEIKSKILYSHLSTESCKAVSEYIDTIIPELAESEDERIRKEIIDYLGLVGKGDGDYAQPMIDRWIAYLEKQKEQKPVEWDNTDMKEARANLISVCRDWEFGKKTTLIPTAALRARYFLEHLVEPQKPAEWSDTDTIGWDEAFACVTRAEKAAKNEEELQNAVTAEKWLKEIKFKYYVHPVKQEWSEEDEKMLKCCLIAINHYEKTCNIGDHRPTKFNIYGYLAGVDKVKSWLKSLRPQPRWKPSEEQMDALAYAIQLLDDGLSPKAAKAGEELEHFREQLKKL